MSTVRLSIFLVALLALAACGDQRAPAAGGNAAPVHVVVEPLRIDTARTRLEAVGTSRAVRSIELHPAASGEVTAVNFQPGQFVEAGAVLVELEKREEELALALAKVRLEDAERLYDRYLRSADSGAVLPTTIDQARTAVEAARIELERAEVSLDYRTIRAPFAGHVGVTDVDPGDRINPDTAITTLDDRSALLVSFEAPEALNGQVRVGDEVAITTWNGREPTAYGRVEDIGSRVDPASRTFIVRARVANEDDALRPGMSFRAVMELTGTPYPVVTETAVQWGADGAYIWSVRDKRAERVPVTVVQRKQGSVLVETSLARGTPVVVEGVQRMRNGLDVSFEPPPSLAADERETGRLPDAD